MPVQASATRQFAARDVVPPQFVARNMPFRRGPFFRGYGYDYGYYYPHYYVVAEKRGRDVTWNTFTWNYQVYDRVANLRTEARGTAEANAQLRKELGQLKSRANGVRASIGRESDPVAKQKLQAELTQVEQTIRAKETSIRPVVIWRVVGPYDRRHLDSFILRLEQEARALKGRPGY